MMDYENDYSVEELLAQLMEDESWESDPHYRKQAIEMLRGKVFPNA